VTRQVINSDDLRKVVLSSDEVYKIDLKTHLGEEIIITSKTEGEYLNEIRLDTEQRGNTLYLSSLFRETFKDGYDKLSAHKVFSMELELQVPRGMTIEIHSNVASVFLSGKYERVFVQLYDGSFYLKNFTGDGIINTLNGNITGTVTGVDIEANSRHGKVEVPFDHDGKHKMILTSINGDIKISENK